MLCGSLLLGLSIIAGCSDSNYQNGKVTEPTAEVHADTVESKPAEYIIVLVDNASLKAAIRDLQPYEAVVIRDLKHGRYLVGLKEDPGMERLQADIKASVHIQMIQPNYTYTTQ